MLIDSANETMIHKESPDEPEPAQVSETELLVAIKRQFEYYFSKENLQQDVYLMSHMTSDMSAPISVLMKFAKIKALTHDESLVVRALQDSTVLSVEGNKIKIIATKTHGRSTIILREIPPDTPLDEVKEIFNFEGCKPIVSLRSDLGNTWFVTMESEEEAKDTLFDVRLKKRLFRGQAVKGRLKSETIIRSFYPMAPSPPLPLLFPTPLTLGGFPLMGAPVMQPSMYGYPVAAGVTVVPAVMALQVVDAEAVGESLPSNLSAAPYIPNGHGLYTAPDSVGNSEKFNGNSFSGSTHGASKGSAGDLYNQEISLTVNGIVNKVVKDYRKNAAANGSGSASPLSVSGASAAAGIGSKKTKTPAYSNLATSSTSVAPNHRPPVEISAANFPPLSSSARIPDVVSRQKDAQPEEPLVMKPSSGIKNAIPNGAKYEDTVKAENLENKPISVESDGAISCERNGAAAMNTLTSSSAATSQEPITLNASHHDPNTHLATSSWAAMVKSTSSVNNGKIIQTSTMEHSRTSSVNKNSSGVDSGKVGSTQTSQKTSVTSQSPKRVSARYVTVNNSSCNTTAQSTPTVQEFESPTVSAATLKTISSPAEGLSDRSASLLNSFPDMGIKFTSSISVLQAAVASSSANGHNNSQSLLSSDPSLAPDLVFTIENDSSLPTAIPASSVEMADASSNGTINGTPSAVVASTTPTVSPGWAGKPSFAAVLKLQHPQAQPTSETILPNNTTVTIAKNAGSKSIVLQTSFQGRNIQKSGHDIRPSTDKDPRNMSSSSGSQDRSSSHFITVDNKKKVNGQSRSRVYNKAYDDNSTSWRQHRSRHYSDGDSGHNNVIIDGSIGVYVNGVSPNGSGSISDKSILKDSAEVN